MWPDFGLIEGCARSGQEVTLRFTQQELVNPVASSVPEGRNIYRTSIRTEPAQLRRSGICFSRNNLCRSSGSFCALRECRLYKYSVPLGLKTEHYLLREV